MPTKPTGSAGAVAARAPPTGREPQPGGESAEGDPLDAWLQRHLHQFYGAIAAEPIPEELLRLIEEGKEP